jgi:hypothetical protein
VGCVESKNLKTKKKQKNKKKRRKKNEELGLRRDGKHRGMGSELGVRCVYL